MIKKNLKDFTRRYYSKEFAIDDDNGREEFVWESVACKVANTTRNWEINNLKE